MSGAAEMLGRAHYVVECTDFEKSALWRGYAAEAPEDLRDCLNKPRVSWKQETLGWAAVLRAKPRPIVIQVSAAVIGGRRVVFWYPCSELVDWKLCRRWIERHSPQATRRENADNFHNVMREICE